MFFALQHSLRAILFRSFRRWDRFLFAGSQAETRLLREQNAVLRRHVALLSEAKGASAEADSSDRSNLSAGEPESSQLSAWVAGPAFAE